ncbi:MAG: DUF342 domain-containing protein [Tissierellia bacterium]|nr:DUF342 domain-containing protein [Tissierellia bacterium]
MQKIIMNSQIEISRDGLKAYMTLLEKDKNNNNIEKTIDEIKSIIKVGLNIEKVKKVLYDGITNERIQIAEGIPPIDGKDGYIKYNFDIKKKGTPKILEDGSVDYKELDIINNVAVGEILAEIIPPQEGKPGKKVTGETIPYKRGKEPKINYGKNVYLSKNNNALIAKKSGLVTFINNKLVVLDVYEVDNVDNSVGNINFDGTVIVKKNVLNGFKITAKGDVQVNGIIEGGYIENTGNVIVKRGIQGYNKLVVRSLGNITSKFIENAKIISEKDIYAEMILHSEVSCKGSVNLYGRRGLIVGGVVRSGKEICAKTVGSVMHTTTILEVGIDPEIKDRLENIKHEINVKENELKKIIKTYKLLERLKKANRLDNKKDQLYKKVEKTKIVLMEELERLNNEYMQLNKQIMSITEGKIKVLDVVYPGVKVIIGNSSFTVREEMKRCTFYIEGGEIKIGTY